MFKQKYYVIVLLVGALCTRTLAETNEDSLFIANNYDKQEVMIVMRDGVKLFTAIYSPKDKSEKYPILIKRSPYSSGPYGEEHFRNNLGPSKHFIKEKYIFIYQDVRGRFLSTGKFVNMRPQIDNKKARQQIDESSDTYDSIDWLIAHVENNNGKVGIYGISYPGFYTTAGAIGSHPNLTAVSPQAPIADWWYDDFHHHGAFFLPHSFNFMSIFGQPRPKPTTKWGKRFQHGTKDGYRWFLEELGPLKNANLKFFKDTIAFWTEITKHPNYDAFWQAQNLLPHLNNIKCAVLTVGGFFDAEDLYGPLKIYKSIEDKNPGINNKIVMGPWRHGGWNRDDGSRLGNVFFGDKPKSSEYFQEKIQLPFFNHHLKGADSPNLAEATVFETGANVWHNFETWPPENIEKKKLYFHSRGGLSFKKPDGEGVESFDSDPANPVPYTETINIGMTREYMTDDQRFASRRPDVLVFQTDVLKEDITLAGPSLANLVVTTTQTAADWIVKLIDVYPDDHEQYEFTQEHMEMGGYQQMVRSEVIRGRFRNSYEKPEPFIPNTPATVDLELLDVLHTFKKGHRIMIQVQSTWFPLVDRNPQKYVDNIFEANEEDFLKARHQVYISAEKGSFIEVGVLKKD